MSPGSAPTLLMRLPSTTMASLRADGFPEPSISVPLRMTSVFLAALMSPPAELLRLRNHTAARQVAVLRLAHAYSLSPRGGGGGGGAWASRSEPPHPNPLPAGERERASASADFRTAQTYAVRPCAATISPTCSLRSIWARTTAPMSRLSSAALRSALG